MLPLLVPHAVLPHQYSDRSRALALLRRIDSIELVDVVKRDGARHYVIDVHYKLAVHGIPTSVHKRKTPRGHRHSTPCMRVLRRFSEFSNLCCEAYFHAHVGHESSPPCAFCHALKLYVDTSATQPRFAMKLLHGDDKVRLLLERFLTEVVSLTIRGVKAFGGRDCHGQEHVPYLLLEFLLPHESSSLGARAAQLSVQAMRFAEAEEREQGE